MMREATEGFYPDCNMGRGRGKMMPDPDMALSIRKITRRGCDRIARRAFDLARTRRRTADLQGPVACPAFASLVAKRVANG